MTASMFQPGDLESLVTTGLRAEPGELYGWRCCRPDLRSRDGFRWPWPGGVATQDGPADGADCGVGLHLAKTWEGAASGGYGCHVALIVAYRSDDVLGDGAEKLRVRAARVLDVLDTPALIRAAKAVCADLSRANLSRADLYGANLSRANLSRANLSRATGRNDWDALVARGAIRGAS